MIDLKTIVKFDRSQWVVIGVALGMLVCFVALVCVPDARKMSDLESRTAEAETQWAAQKTDVEALPQLSRRVADLKERASVLAVKVPAQPELPQFLGELADALKKAEARQHQIMPQAQRAADKYTALPVQVTFEATYPAVYGILRRLESMPRVVTVEALKISKVPGENNQVSVEMRLAVYCSQAPAKAPAKQVASSGQGGVH